MVQNYYMRHFDPSTINTGGLGNPLRKGIRSKKGYKRAANNFFFYVAFLGHTAIHRAIIETVGNLGLGHPQARLSQMILLLE
jgi:hypothetical protein